MRFIKTAPIFLIALFALVALAPSATAHESPGLVSCGKDLKPCNFCELFHTGQHVINFMIFGLAIPLTGLFFLIGGFLIMVSGVTAFTEWTGKSGTALHSTGVKAITGSVIGIFIVLVAWVFINTLLNFIVAEDKRRFPAPWYQIQCKRVAAAPAVAPPPAIPPEVAKAEEEMRAILAGAGITVNKSPCPPGKSYNVIFT